MKINETIIELGINLKEGIKMTTQVKSTKHEEMATQVLAVDIGKFIDNARLEVARTFNGAQVTLCWLIGNRINEAILNAQKAQYGEQIIIQLANELTLKYGSGFGRAKLFRMVQFTRLFTDLEIVVTLSRQLSWSHFILLIAIEDKLKRDFYAEMSRASNWSMRQLKAQIDSMMYERTAISKQPEEIARLEIAKLQEKDQLTPRMLFKDPYFLDFVGLDSSYSENDLESAILNEIAKFLQELGTDFCFVERQKRMSTGKKDRYLDLLLYNRSLQRLIAIDLKIGEFDPAYKGQMEWYLKWLDKNERKPWENRPIGIILCADKDEEDIKYLELDNSNIHVAQYLTGLPPKAILETKLRQAINAARESYARKEITELLDKKVKLDVI